MRRLPFIVALLALCGCYSDPEPDVAGLGGPYDDGGYYYDRPRDIGYDVEERDLYARQYYYPAAPYGYAYPYDYGFYGGYYRNGYRDRHEFDRDHGRNDHDDGPGRSRERGSPPPRDRSDPPTVERRTDPHGPGQAVAPRPPRPAGGSAGPAGSAGDGGPHGRH